LVIVLWAVATPPAITSVAAIIKAFKRLILLELR
jgi:hypothetical protein